MREKERVCVSVYECVSRSGVSAYPAFAVIGFHRPEMKKARPLTELLQGVKVFALTNNLIVQLVVSVAQTHTDTHTHTPKLIVQASVLKRSAEHTPASILHHARVGIGKKRVAKRDKQVDNCHRLHVHAYTGAMGTVLRCIHFTMNMRTTTAAEP